MRRVLVIGIGAGNIEQLTLEAIAALNEVDVFLVPDKGEAKAELVAFRERVCARFILQRPYRFVSVPDPKRGPDAERDESAYLAGVRDWHSARVAAYAEIMAATEPEATIGFLVWGDPAFYDSTLRITASLRDLIDFEQVVIPGISAVQLLAAAHQIPLNRVGTSIHVTTGRRLVAEYHPGLGDVVVMLDGQLACRELVATYPDLHLYWGAYLGANTQVLRDGRLTDVIAEVVSLRAELRAEHGWLMDTYLLRP